MTALDPLALTQENFDWALDRVGTLTERCEELAQALRLTQEYVGDELLPPVEGWSWFDALRTHEEVKSDDSTSNGSRLEPPLSVVDDARAAAIAVMQRCVSVDIDSGHDTVDTIAAAETIAEEVVGLAWVAFVAALPGPRYRNSRGHTDR